MIKSVSIVVITPLFPYAQNWSYSVIYICICNSIKFSPKTDTEVWLKQTQNPYMVVQSPRKLIPMTVVPCWISRPFLRVQDRSYGGKTVLILTISHAGTVLYLTIQHINRSFRNCFIKKSYNRGHINRSRHHCFTVANDNVLWRGSARACECYLHLRSRGVRTDMYPCIPQLYLIPHYIYYTDIHT